MKEIAEDEDEDEDDWTGTKLVVETNDSEPETNSSNLPESSLQTISGEKVEEVFVASEGEESDAHVTIEQLEDSISSTATLVKQVVPRLESDSTSLHDSIYGLSKREAEAEAVEQAERKEQKVKKPKKKFRYLTKTERKFKVGKEKGRNKEKKRRAK